MKLVKINAPTPVYKVLCILCNHWTNTNEGYADLDEKPFVAYYCPFCAKELGKELGGEQEAPEDAQD